MNIKQRKMGLSLIELIIVISIIAILAVAGLITFMRFYGYVKVKKSFEGTVSVLRNVQGRAIAKENDSDWGVYFSNEVGNVNYKVFYGPSYAAGTVVSTYYYPQGVAFTPQNEIVFQKQTGKLAEPQVIFLWANYSGGSFSFKIDVDANGFIKTSEGGI